MAEDTVTVEQVEEALDSNSNADSTDERTTEEDVAEHVAEHVAVADRKKWLTEQAFQQKSPQAQSASSDNEQNVKWLQEHKASTGKYENDPEVHISNELTTNKVKWLQEQAFEKSKKDTDEVQISNELTTDKVKWLQEQAFEKKKKNNEDIDEVQISNELTKDKVKWLQEQNFPSNQQQNDSTTIQEENKTSDKTQVEEDKQMIDSENDDSEVGDEDSEMDDDDSNVEEQNVETSNSKDVATTHNADLYELLNATKARLAATQEKYLNKKDEDDSKYDHDEDSLDLDDESLCNDDYNSKNEVNESSVRNEENHNSDEDGVGNLPPMSIVGVLSKCSVNEDLSEEDMFDQSQEEKKGETTIACATGISRNSSTESPKCHEETKEPQAPSMTNQEIRREEQQKDNRELWALLNYSKVRLATGATPTELEARALGVSTGNEMTSAENEDNNDESDSEEDDESNVSIQSTDNHDDEDYDDISFDASNLDGNEGEKRTEGKLNDSDLISYDGTFKNANVTKSSLTNRSSNDDARVRALAALAMASSRETNNSHFPPDPEIALSEKQLLQSMLLAEEASLSGEKDFSTKDKIAFLDKIQIITPRKKKDGKEASNDRRRNVLGFRGGGGNNGQQKDKKDFGEKTRNFFARTKMKAENAMKEMKGIKPENVMKEVQDNIAKVEDHKGDYNFQSQQLSPLKVFQERLKQVDQMYEFKNNKNVEHKSRYEV